MKSKMFRKNFQLQTMVCLLSLEVFCGTASAQTPLQGSSASQEPIVVHFDQHSDMGIFSTRKRGFPGMWEEDDLQVQNSLVNPVRKLSPEVNVNDLEPVEHEQD